MSQGIRRDFGVPLPMGRGDGMLVEDRPVDSIDAETHLWEIRQALQYVLEQAEQNQQSLRELEKRKQFINEVQGVQQQIFDRLDRSNVSTCISRILQQSVVERERFRKASQVVLAQARKALEGQRKQLASQRDDLERLLSTATLLV